MRRLLAAVGVGAIAAIAAMAPAAAQYQPGETTTTTAAQEASTTTTTPSTTTTEPATTTTDAPPPARQEAEVTNSTPAPGESIDVMASPIDGQTAFDADEPLTAGMSSANGDVVIALVPVLHFDDDGTVRVTVQIPEGTPEGIYYLFVVGTDPAGNPRVLVVPIVVSSTLGSQSSAAGVSATSFSSSPRIDAPPQVKAVLAPMTPAEEADIIDAVVNHDATIELDGQLLVVTRPADDDGGRPLVAAAAVSLVGGSLVLLRRKPAGVIALSRR